MGRKEHMKFKLIYKQTEGQSWDLCQGLVMQASGSLVNVDIPELSESPWTGFDIFFTSMGLGRRMVEELDQKLTLGMAERW